MKIKVFISALIVYLFFFIALFAKEMIYIDNQDIQGYKGRLGLWIMVESNGKLYYLIKKYSVSIKEIKSINKIKTLPGNYVFIPFSDSYLNELYLNGKKRDYVFSSEDEYIWPLQKIERITSSFGMRWGQLHTGVDLPAPKWTPVIVAKDGRVVFSGYSGGHGKSLCIEHRNNFFTKYSHNSVLLVKKGDYVKKGQIIALLGSTGNSTGNHLHFEIRYNDIPLNPLDFLPPKEHLQKVYMLRSVELGK